MKYNILAVPDRHLASKIVLLKILEHVFLFFRIFCEMKTVFNFFEDGNNNKRRFKRKDIRFLLA